MFKMQIWSKRQNWRKCIGKHAQKLKVFKNLSRERPYYIRSVIPSTKGTQKLRIMTGVNTGFGGSANTHTNNVDKLQRNLISFLNCGVLNPPNITNPAGRQSAKPGHEETRFVTALPNEDPVASSTMPESWVRSTLLIRCNSLASGNSGVRSALVDGLVHMLQNNLTPVIPLRGSISASGDLIPLSYVAGALQGSPAVQIWMTDRRKGRQQLSADVALAKHSQTPLRLGPKEGLAIVNGTAVSAGVGSLALHDAHGLIILSQVLTAMGVEALGGSAESFHPFFSNCRPHPGQSEAAENILAFLSGSKLLSSDNEHDCENGDSLRQDRYSIRTAPQWLGPQIENLMLADQQLSIEVNSTTDNPIIDTENQKILHGGNFQAMSVTSAVEKIRSSLQVIGRMLFAQCTELINPALNNGLSPNLTADDPSQNFLLKGIDISIASLQAELGFLAGSVEPHVQNAEMGNQSLNSLALLSARYTHTALSVLSQLSAAYLLTLCQALDLRVLYIRFLAALEPSFEAAAKESFEPYLTNLDKLHQKLWTNFRRELRKTTAMDSSERFSQIINSLQPTIITHARTNSNSDSSLGIQTIQQWNTRLSTLSLQTYQSTRKTYAANPDSSEFLGPASKRIYRYVRGTLGVEFQISVEDGVDKKFMSGVDGCNVTIGVQISKINAAIQNGALFVPVMECLRKIDNER